MPSIFILGMHFNLKSKQLVLMNEWKRNPENQSRQLVGLQIELHNLWNAKAIGQKKRNEKKKKRKKKTLKQALFCTSSPHPKNKVRSGLLVSAQQFRRWKSWWESCIGPIYTRKIYGAHTCNLKKPFYSSPLNWKILNLSPTWIMMLHKYIVLVGIFLERISS